MGLAEIVLVIGVVAAVAIIAGMYFMTKHTKCEGDESRFAKRRREAEEQKLKGTRDREAAELDKKLVELEAEKKRIDSMIKLANKKYYKREIDEEMLKALVRENQQKAIDVESQINDIKRRITALESKD